MADDTDHCTDPDSDTCWYMATYTRFSDWSVTQTPYNRITDRDPDLTRQGLCYCQNVTESILTATDVPYDDFCAV